MHECLRCGQACETGVFCDLCQSSLLQRSQRDEPTLFSAHVPQVQVAELSPLQATSFVATTQEMEGLQTDGQDLQTASDKLPSGSQWSPSTRVDLTSASVSLPVAQVLQARRARLNRLRRIFIFLALLATIALVVDCVLVSLVFTRQNGNEPVVQPMLTLSPNIVYPGQLARLHLQHFSPMARVLLRRNVDEPVRLDPAASLIRVNAQGDADVHVLVEDSWGNGNHSIEAEDIGAHYVASVSVQVIGSAPARPSHLQLSQQTVSLGANGQGASTLQSITLQNTGSGRITWTAWSNQPWLMLTPTQGAFSESQRVVIAACRAHLRPGDYEGMVTFVSNTGTSVSLRVTMTVLATQASERAMLVVTPPVLSFVATDGGPDPQEQTLTISNPGSRPLYWSFDHSAPTVSVDQQLPLVDKMDWVEVTPRSGTLKPGATIPIHLRVHSHNLIPSVYSGILTFTGGQNALNDPQPVALSLVVQPRCGITTNTGSLSFTTVVGQQAAAQTLLLSQASECSGTLSWRASSLAKWLTLTPATGSVSAQSNSLSSVQVKSSDLAPGTYNGFLVFLTERRTQTVSVQLTVLAPGQSLPGGQQDDRNATATSLTDGGGRNTASSSPALALSSLNLTFRINQGDASPPGQSVSVANTGGTLLYWQAHTDASGQSWLTVSPTTGMLSTGQTGAIMLNVDGSSLEPGTYRSNVLVTATNDAGVQVSGSPQVLVVTLKVMQPCTLRVTPTNLSFSSSLLSGEPADQTITLQGVGDCSLPILWKASVDANSQSWIHLSASSGRDTGDGSVLWVRVTTNGTLLGFNRGQITFSASDSFGSSLRNSPQTVNVTLSVLG